MDFLVKKLIPYYQQIRRQIHANPELKYQEYKTAALVAQQLTNLGLPVQTEVGQTGVVAVLDSQRPGKTIALRADLDALPIHEQTGLIYQSNNTGVMHACGHDGHTATLLATAHVLVKHKIPAGKVKFIFQPAEEGGAGAKAMIDDGVLVNPTVDAIFAYHNYPGLAVGKVLVRNGCTLNGDCAFDIHIQGKGGHAAQPEKVINPNIAVAQLISQLHPYAIALNQGMEPAIIAVSQLNSGTARNVIPNYATIKGTIRAPSLAKLSEIKASLDQIRRAVAQATQTQIAINFPTFYPPTINSPVETALVMSQAKQLFGENNVLVKEKPARAAEDFSYYLQQVPGCYFFIGNGDSAYCHNALYDFNDALMYSAVTLLANIAIRYLS